MEQRETFSKSQRLHPPPLVERALEDAGWVHAANVSRAYERAITCQGYRKSTLEGFIALQYCKDLMLYGGSAKHLLARVPADDGPAWWYEDDYHVGQFTEDAVTFTSQWQLCMHLHEHLGKALCPPNKPLPRSSEEYWYLPRTGDGYIGPHLSEPPLYVVTTERDRGPSAVASTYDLLCLNRLRAWPRLDTYAFFAPPRSDIPAPCMVMLKTLLPAAQKLYDWAHQCCEMRHFISQVYDMKEQFRGEWAGLMAQTMDQRLSYVVTEQRRRWGSVPNGLRAIMYTVIAQNMHAANSSTSITMVEYLAALVPFENGASVPFRDFEANPPADNSWNPNSQWPQEQPYGAPTGEPAGHVLEVPSQLNSCALATILIHMSGGGIGDLKHGFTTWMQFLYKRMVGLDRDQELSVWHLHLLLHACEGPSSEKVAMVLCLIDATDDNYDFDHALRSHDRFHGGAKRAKRRGGCPVVIIGPYDATRFIMAASRAPAPEVPARHLAPMVNYYAPNGRFGLASREEAMANLVHYGAGTIVCNQVFPHACRVADCRVESRYIDLPGQITREIITRLPGPTYVRELSADALVGIEQFRPNVTPFDHCVFGTDTHGEQRDSPTGTPRTLTSGRPDINPLATAAPLVSRSSPPAQLEGRGAAPASIGADAPAEIRRVCEAADQAAAVGAAEAEAEFAAWQEAQRATRALAMCATASRAHPMGLVAAAGSPEYRALLEEARASLLELPDAHVLRHVLEHAPDNPAGHGRVLVAMLAARLASTLSIHATAALGQVLILADWAIRWKRGSDRNKKISYLAWKSLALKSALRMVLRDAVTRLTFLERRMVDEPARQALRAKHRALHARLQPRLTIEGPPKIVVLDDVRRPPPESNLAPPTLMRQIEAQGQNMEAQSQIIQRLAEGVEGCNRRLEGVIASLNTLQHGQATTDDNVALLQKRVTAVTNEVVPNIARSITLTGLREGLRDTTFHAPRTPSHLPPANNGGRQEPNRRGSDERDSGTFRLSTVTTPQPPWHRSNLHPSGRNQLAVLAIDGVPGADGSDVYMPTAMKAIVHSRWGALELRVILGDSLAIIELPENHTTAAQVDQFLHTQARSLAGSSALGSDDTKVRVAINPGLCPEGAHAPQYVGLVLRNFTHLDTRDAGILEIVKADNEEHTSFLWSAAAIHQQLYEHRNVGELEVVRHPLMELMAELLGDRDPSAGTRHSFAKPMKTHYDNLTTFKKGLTQQLRDALPEWTDAVAHVSNYHFKIVKALEAGQGELARFACQVPGAIHHFLCAVSARMTESTFGGSFSAPIDEPVGQDELDKLARGLASLLETQMHLPAAHASQAQVKSFCEACKILLCSLRGLCYGRTYIEQSKFEAMRLCMRNSDDSRWQSPLAWLKVNYTAGHNFLRLMGDGMVQHFISTEFAPFLESIVKGVRDSRDTEQMLSVAGDFVREWHKTNSDNGASLAEFMQELRSAAFGGTHRSPLGGPDLFGSLVLPGGMVRRGDQTAVIRLFTKPWDLRMVNFIDLRGFLAFSLRLLRDDAGYAQIQVMDAVPAIMHTFEDDTHGIDTLAICHEAERNSHHQFFAAPVQTVLPAPPEEASAPAASPPRAANAFQQRLLGLGAQSAANMTRQVSWADQKREELLQQCEDLHKKQSQDVNRFCDQLNQSAAAESRCVSTQLDHLANNHTELGRSPQPPLALVAGVNEDKRQTHVPFQSGGGGRQPDGSGSRFQQRAANPAGQDKWPRMPHQTPRGAPRAREQDGKPRLPGIRPRKVRRGADGAIQMRYADKPATEWRQIPVSLHPMLASLEVTADNWHLQGKKPCVLCMSPPEHVTDHTLDKCVFLWSATDAGKTFFGELRASEKVADMMATATERRSVGHLVAALVSDQQADEREQLHDYLLNGLMNIEVAPDDDLMELEDICRSCDAIATVEEIFYMSSSQ